MTSTKNDCLWPKVNRVKSMFAPSPAVPAGDAWPEDRALPNGLSAPSFLLPVFHRITKD
jgi:hypothetical protein